MFLSSDSALHVKDSFETTLEKPACFVFCSQQQLALKGWLRCMVQVTCPRVGYFHVPQLLPDLSQRTEGPSSCFLFLTRRKRISGRPCGTINLAPEARNFQRNNMGRPQTQVFVFFQNGVSVGSRGMDFFTVLHVETMGATLVLNYSRCTMRFHHDECTI